MSGGAAGYGVVAVMTGDSQETDTAASVEIWHVSKQFADELRRILVHLSACNSAEFSKGGTALSTIENIEAIAEVIESKVVIVRE